MRGDGDAMGVAPEIGEYLGGFAERLLGVDDPSGAAQWAARAWKLAGSARCASSLKNLRAPASKAFEEKRLHHSGVATTA
jgi:hypothetical protein